MSALSTLLTELSVTVVPTADCAGVRSVASQRLPTISMPPSMSSGRFSPLTALGSESVCTIPSTHTRMWRASVRSGEPKATRSESEIGMR